jgi:hypothetical protein
VSATLVGEGDHVRTRATLTFPQPLALDLEPWNIPTNLVSMPLISFTAARGLRPWLSALNEWVELGIDPAPNQFYAWGLEGPAAQMFFAVPQADASNQLARICGLVLGKQEHIPWLASNEWARFKKSRNFNGLEWNGPPLLTPYLTSIPNGRGGLMLGGFGPLGPTNFPPPPELFQQILQPANLISYAWEATGPRIEQEHQAIQFVRFIMRKAQMAAGAPARVWLEKAESRLGFCATQVTRETPRQLSLERKSTIGLSAFELNLLTDWLESPDFPSGLHTLDAPAPAE